MLSSVVGARVSRLLALTACAALLAGPALAQNPPAATPKKEGAPVTSGAPAGGEKKDVAVIKTTMGTIVFEFLPDVAPKMVDNFKELAKSHFYDGTTFHRVIKGFMIQGGDPLSKDNDPNNDGSGNGPRRMQAEFTTKYKHVPGIVSTARTSDPNSGSCQFFIMDGTAPSLDNQYTIFGRVIEGQDVVGKIVSVPKDARDRPLKNVTMESVTIEKR
ncbi:MAG TPA: peptidylprolyl isomerase [Candidatus Polarisedimenticolia bacterium]|nr:peptidylprolyl isomerase [Candidatus Polarisedimenticolia bacterium]